MKKQILRTTPKPFKFEKDVAYFLVDFMVGGDSFSRTYLCFVDETGNLIRVDSKKPIKKTLKKLREEFNIRDISFNATPVHPTASKLQADLSDFILALVEEKKADTFVKLDT